MLKVTQVAQDNQSVTLKVEGRIVGPWVNELRQECGKCLARRSKIILDLSGVSFADDQGIKTLKAMIEQQARWTKDDLKRLGLL